MHSRSGYEGKYRQRPCFRSAVPPCSFLAAVGSVVPAFLTSAGREIPGTMPRTSAIVMQRSKASSRLFALVETVVSRPSSSTPEARFHVICQAGMNTTTFAV